LLYFGKRDKIAVTVLEHRSSTKATMTERAIAFEQVGLRLGGVTIYDALSFDVRDSEFVCLLGPSGCGKSTALRLIGDLLPVQGGMVLVEGRSPAEAWERLAYVFQSPRLLPWKDALDNAAFGLEMRVPAMPAGERRMRAKRQLDRMGLAADAHKMPLMLSGGERQRVALARALALDPDIILMDEPFSALDPNTRARLRQQLVELWQGSGKTILFVTHDVDEALTLADRIIVLSPKPARVVHVMQVAAQRPRQIESDPALRNARRELLELFATLTTGSMEDAS
jgi:NitT/TauT family transport system ATP-binding protein